jgi:hypothetical protein
MQPSHAYRNLLACAFCHVIARGKQRNDIYFKYADRELNQIKGSRCEPWSLAFMRPAG